MMPQNGWPEPNCGNGVAKMRVLLSTWGRAETSNRCWDSQGIAGTRRGSADVRAAGFRGACGPRRCPDGACGQSRLRDLVHGYTTGSRRHLPMHHGCGGVGRAQFETVAAAAEGCDALVATGLMPAGARTVAEVRGIPYVLVSFFWGSFPSPHHAPMQRPGKPFPPGETDNECCGTWMPSGCRRSTVRPLNAHRAALGLPPVDNVQRPRFHDSPGLRPTRHCVRGLGRPYIDVVQTGAWILPDDRPLPAASRPSSTQAHRRCT